MHKAVLGAVAAATLIAPAVAQQMNNVQTHPGQPQAGQEPRSQQEQQQPRQQAPGPSQAMTGRAIAPELLSARQIRDIQQALESRGARQIRVDGRWGDDIEAAVRNFQRTENMISQNGELDPLTLMALGLNPMNFGMSGAAETTGQAPREAADPHERMQEPPVREQPIREQDR